METDSEPVAVSPFPLKSGPTAMDRLSAGSAEPSGQLSLVLAWIGSIAVVLAFLAGLYVERSAVVAFWPTSHRLYNVFGISP